MNMAIEASAPNNSHQTLIQRMPGLIATHLNLQGEKRGVCCVVSTLSRCSFVYACGRERLGDELGGSRIGAKALTFIICL